MSHSNKSSPKEASSSQEFIKKTKKQTNSDTSEAHESYANMVTMPH